MQNQPNIEIYDNLEHLTRELDSETAKRILEIILSCYRNNPGNTYTPEQLKAFEHWYTSPTPSSPYSIQNRFSDAYGVLCYGGAIEPINLVGLATLKEDVLDSDEKFWQLKLMYVEPEHQGRGIAKNLAEKIEVKAKNMGLDSLVITSTLFPEALNFYQRRGYEKLREANFPFPLPNDNATVDIKFICMAKRL